MFDTLPIERPHELFFVFWGPRIDGLSGVYSDGRLDAATGKQLSSNISFPAYQELQQLQRPGVSLAAFTFIRFGVAPTDAPTLAVAAVTLASSRTSKLPMRFQLVKI